MLGPQVGDLTGRGSDSDDEIYSGCCLWSPGCLFRRDVPEESNKSSNSDSNKPASGGVAEEPAPDVTVAPPSKGSFEAVKTGDKEEAVESGVRPGNSCTSQGEIGEIGCTRSSVDTTIMTDLASSDCCTAALGAAAGQVRVPEEDVAPTSTAPARPDLADQNAGPLVRAAGADAYDADVKSFAASDAATITVSSTAVATAAQSQVKVDLASQDTVDAVASGKGKEMNHLGGNIDADANSAVQQSCALERADLGQLLIDLRQVIAVIS